MRARLLIILTAGQPRQAEAAPPPVVQAALCLQAGLFDDIQAAVLRQSAQTLLPAGRWSLDEISEPARWIVYMGRFPDGQAMARKQAELAALQLRTEPIENPALANGLSLGGFDSQEKAVSELAALVKRGVRTAQVVQERAGTHASMLRISQVDDAVRARIEELRPALAGKTLRACS